jgi:chromate transport protein ChrA
LARRAISAGLIAVAVAWVAGFAIVGLRNAFALVAVFLLATVVAAVRRAGFAATVQRHPYCQQRQP